LWCAGVAVLLCPFNLPRRSRRQGLRVPCTLASWRPSLAAPPTLDRLRCGVGGRFRAIPPDFEPEPIMSQLSSTFTLDSSLLVRDVAGSYRPAEPEEVLQAALRVLADQLHGTEMLSSPQAVRDFLRIKLGTLEHEVFSVIHLDAQHRVIEYVEMFRGTVTQTSVYPREVVKEAMTHNTAAIVLVHNHPSGVAEPSRADEHLTQTLKSALSLVDVRVIDHLIVAGPTILSFAERGLI